MDITDNYESVSDSQATWHPTGRADRGEEIRIEAEVSR
jgi:hypothetical protein